MHKDYGIQAFRHVRTLYSNNSHVLIWLAAYRSSGESRDIGYQLSTDQQPKSAHSTCLPGLV